MDQEQAPKQIYVWDKKQQQFTWVNTDLFPDWQRDSFSFIQLVLSYLSIRKWDPNDPNLPNLRKKMALFKLRKLGMATFEELEERPFTNDYQSEHLEANLFILLLTSSIHFVNQYKLHLINVHNPNITHELYYRFSNTLQELCKIHSINQSFSVKHSDTIQTSFFTMWILNLIKIFQNNSSSLEENEGLVQELETLLKIVQNLQFEPTQETDQPVLYLRQPISPLLQAIKVLKQILTSEDTNPYVFRTIQLLNEVFTSQKITVHLQETNESESIQEVIVHSNNIKYSPVDLGLELVRILESCDLSTRVLFFNFQSQSLAYTLPCGQIAFKRQLFDKPESNDLRLAAKYLLTIFHELFHLKRLINVNSFKYLKRTPKKHHIINQVDHVLTYNYQQSIIREEIIAEAGQFFEKTVFGQALKYKMVLLSDKTSEMILNPFYWKGDMVELKNAMHEDVTSESFESVAAKGYCYPFRLLQMCGRIENFGGRDHDYRPPKADDDFLELEDSD